MLWYFLLVYISPSSRIGREFKYFELFSVFDGIVFEWMTEILTEKDENSFILNIIILCSGNLMDT